MATLPWVFFAMHSLFSSSSEQGPLSRLLHRLLVPVASVGVEHGCRHAGFSSHGTQHYLPCGQIPSPGIERLSPALADEFSTTRPPGESSYFCFKLEYSQGGFHMSVVLEGGKDGR